MAPDQPHDQPVPVLAAPATSRPAQLSPNFSRWTLLNPYSARHARLLSLGLVSFRPSPEPHDSVGYSLAFGEVVTTLRPGLTAGALLEHELRYVPNDALSLSVSRYQWEAGPRLGPIEPTVRVGVTLLHLDVGHRFSFGMFSPRVGLGLWVKLPHARVGVSAFTEYFWRWVGSDSAFVHGLTLELQPEAAPLLRPSATSSPASLDHL